jgi:hypothetical protein
MLHQLARDMADSARGLFRDRSFTLTTVATLTVALSLVTVVFAVFNAYVLWPYAVRDPDALYQIRWGAQQGKRTVRGRMFRWNASLPGTRYGRRRDRSTTCSFRLQAEGRVAWFDRRPQPSG